VGWLPDRDEQEWTLDCLRLLARRLGSGVLGRGSLEPTGVVDALRLGTREDVRHAAERVLTFIGAGGKQVEVVIDEVPPKGHAGYARVVFAAPDEVTVGVRPVAVTDPGRRAADLVRALVRNHRVECGLAGGDWQREGRLTDLTGVWLGLGVLLANGADPSLFARDDDIPAAGSRLFTQAICFALAARVIASESGCFATWRLGRTLERVPRRSFLEALGQLRRPRGAVAQRLRLPGHERFGAPRRIPLHPEGPAGAPVPADEPD
jgi:hypothetical protein